MYDCLMEQIKSFGEETDDGIYNVTLVIYDDDDMRLISG